MTLYSVKPRFQAWLRPLVARCAEAGVTANQVTLWQAFRLAGAPAPPTLGCLSRAQPGEGVMVERIGGS